ncbi:hypothetical protein IH779_02180 [Patescibacteria group bacterium]|nr:hypothetical protein [Patescibacteria group bacterium]
MLTHTNLKKGVKIILDEEPYEILEARPLKMAQRRVIIQTKIKNLINGNVFSKNFHQGETFHEADISKIEAKFLYSHLDRKSSISDGTSRHRYFFSKKDDPSKRFDLTSEQIGEQTSFLKPNQIIKQIIFKEKVINIALPVKVQLKVIESPPGIKGGRSQPGKKQVTLETGAKINVPLFIKEEDIIEINTETHEYIRRVE